jgi:crossover junction endodeoxyribonuclease RuvC
MIVIGIDPGLSGAVALVDEGKLRWVEDMPVVPTRYKNKSRNVLNMGSLNGLFRAAAIINGADCVSLEQISAMPGQGVTSMFRFGEVYGAIQALTAASYLPLHMVTPQKWKKHFGLNKAKGVSRAKASQLWPDKADLFKLVKHDGRAEAALIAEYLRQTLGK